MSKRSLILAMVFSSLFGGIVAVVGYSYLNPKEQIIHQTSAANPVSLTKLRIRLCRLCSTGRTEFCLCC